MEPVVGKTYTDYQGNTRTVTHIDRKIGAVTYTKNGRPIVNRTRMDVFIQAYMGDKPEYHGKPLDQAFKELDKKLCSHKNVREDRFFSAMVYKTCKDCGKPLN